MDIRTYLRAIRKGWWIVVLAFVVGGGLGEVRNLTSTPVYASHVTFYVSTPSSGTNRGLSDDQYAERKANSYVELLSSERLGEQIKADTGLPLSPSQIASRISATAQLNTVLVKATVADTSKDRAQTIARAAATELPRLVSELDNQGTQTDEVSVEVVSGPTLSNAPVSPRTKINIGIGALIGLLVGVLAAVLREALNTSVRSSDELVRDFDRPVVGSIGYDPLARRAPLIVEEQARSVRAEAFRQLRTNLRFSDVDRPVRTIVVTSSVASEGKSATSTNLAMVFAEAGNRVLLVEADLRRPRVTEYLSLEREVGLTNVLAGQVDLDDALQPWGTTGMHVLPSGSIPPNPSELLGSQNMADLIAELRARFEIVIIDTPPLLPVTDAAVAAKLCDGVVLVVRHGRTSRSHVATSLASLDAVGARVLGFVINMVPRRSRGSNRYDGYGYYEDENARSAHTAAPRRGAPDRSVSAPAADVGLGIVQTSGPGVPPPGALGMPPPAVPGALDPARVGDDVTPAGVTLDTEAGRYGNGSDVGGAPPPGDTVWAKSGGEPETPTGQGRRRRRPRPPASGNAHPHLAGQRRR